MKVFTRLMSLIIYFILALQIGCVSSAQFETVSNDYLKEIKQCDQTLNSQIAKNQHEKQALVEQIEKLNRNLEQKEKIISVQETVIRLFDDSEQTLQNTIQDQLTNQNLDTSSQSLSARDPA